MALDDRTAQEQLTPGMRRGMLRAFADRMLLKITAMDDPEDMPGAERAVRVADVIERVYSRCDRAERQRHIEAPDQFKAEADCATHRRAAIKARIDLAQTLEWENKRRRDLGPWWEAAGKATQMPQSESQAPAAPDKQTAQPTQTRVSHALKSYPPSSYTSGDATPAPNLATMETAAKETGNARSGANLRSSASEWPP